MKQSALILLGNDIVLVITPSMTFIFTLMGPWNLCDLGGLLVGGWSVIGALILGWSVNIPTNNIARRPCKIVGW